MRCVPAPAVRWPRPRPDSPGAAALEGVRFLAARFPAARMREVSILRAPDLDATADPSGATRIWVALEALQVTGTVKVRGALVAVAARRHRGQVVAASTGNHGAAVAYAGAVLGVATTVVLPRTVAPIKRDAIARYGAELVVAETDRYDEAERIAREISAARGAAFIPAQDDVDVALGNGASLGFEIARALGRAPGRVLVALDRSGLARGLSWSFAADDPRAPSPVWGAACERGSSLGRPEPDVGAMAGIVLVPDAYISLAMAHAQGHLGVVLEERAAVPLAPVLAGLPPPIRGGDLVVVLADRASREKNTEWPVVASGADGGAI